MVSSSLDSGKVRQATVVKKMPGVEKNNYSERRRERNVVFFVKFAATPAI